MGCAPSIHFSQQGIVFRDSSSPTAPRPIVSSPSEIVGHIRSSSDSGSHISTSSSSRYRGTGRVKRIYHSGRGSSIEAETQTQDLSNMSENPKVEKKATQFCVLKFTV